GFSGNVAGEFFHLTPYNTGRIKMNTTIRKVIFIGSIFICVSFLRAQEDVVKPVIAPKMQYFPLGNVEITGGEFKHIQELTHKYLLTLEPDRLCSWFRREAGLPPKAQPYPGWESSHGYIIPGHILGFYLSSMAMMYETTGDTEIIKRLEYTLQQLDECQNAAGDGFLGANPNLRKVYEQFIADSKDAAEIVKKRGPKSTGEIPGANEPTYIMNKITLGLYDVAVKCNLPLAEKVLVRYADWFGENVLNKMNDDGVQKLLICEHGSFSESYIDVYRLTGNKKYLDWAKRLDHQVVLVPLAEGKDILGGLHANCIIQKNTGFAGVFQYTGDKQRGDAARFFWNTVAKDHTWIHGGNSTREHFSPKTGWDKEMSKNGGPEGCNSVNMLRLTEYLYQMDADPKMLDYYERVLMNHLLGGYEPETGMFAYMTKVNPGAYKTYSTLYDSFWCCTGTGMESPAKFQKMIYTHNDDVLYVNLFIPSTLTWKEKGITLRQTTNIPDEEQTVLDLQLSEPKTFALNIRHPYWTAKDSLKVSLNGEEQKISSSPSEFVTINRQWKNGDKITVSLPMKLEVLPLTSSQKFVSFQYGPVVLAAKADSGDVKKSDYWSMHDHAGNRDKGLPLEKIPHLTGTPEEIAAKTKKVSVSPLTFQTEAAPENYTLMPLNRIHFSRYVLYFPVKNAVPPPK
ncbi:MAG: glycoside hydrolase family 127 protein, partial [Planctomycetaceae bacterium]|nr:glycoside hydrolase family 127 protein [Planctomycetaceae bacterium]